MLGMTDGDTERGKPDSPMFFPVEGIKFKECLDLSPGAKLTNMACTMNSMEDGYGFVTGNKPSKYLLKTEIDKKMFRDLYDWKSSTKQTKNTCQWTRRGTEVVVNKKSIALFRYGSHVYAIDEKCPHAGGPLHLGDIEALGDAESLCVVCPWHKWKISLEDGKVRFPDRSYFTRVYPVLVVANDLLKVGFNSFCKEYFNGDEDF